MTADDQRGRTSEGVPKNTLTFDPAGGSTSPPEEGVLAKLRHHWLLRRVSSPLSAWVAFLGIGADAGAPVPILSAETCSANVFQSATSLIKRAIIANPAIEELGFREVGERLGSLNWGGEVALVV
jgi:hypothetical protein